ncbi:MAG TPA: hypothetical protein VGQ39_02430 [Pyrinomonadaceae bacterium]|nr:hypothetical protein [Pyrinomonadaceae bacterium]
MTYSGPDLLKSLDRVAWNTAIRTFGNCHSTLIGLIVNWWITTDPINHWALDGAPTCGNRRVCDAIFCANNNAVGILEVEGVGERKITTVEKLGSYFVSEFDDLKTLEFAVLLLYAYHLTRDGYKTFMPPAYDPDVFAALTVVSRAHSDKPIIAITLDKTYESNVQGIRKRANWYFSRPSKVTGYLYEAGRESASRVFYSEGSNCIQFAPNKIGGPERG